MANPLTKQELSELLDTARRAGYAEGYAVAKLELALDRVTETKAEPEAERKNDSGRSVTAKTAELPFQAAKSEEDEPYATRTTLAMTKNIALDYLRNVAPRIVGPTEIKKNSEKALNIFISFGTLKRATEALVHAGEIEQIEPSRWRYKVRTDAAGLRSVK